MLRHSALSSVRVNHWLDFVYSLLLIIVGFSAILGLIGCASDVKTRDDVKLSEGSYNRESGYSGSTTWTWNQKPKDGSDEKPSTAPTQEPINRR